MISKFILFHCLILKVVDSIVRGESRSGIGVIRPPGHHAECDEAYGFCVFNNTALAAKHAIEVHHLERYFLKRTQIFCLNNF